MELDKKNMTYGGIIIMTIISAALGGVLIFEDNEGTTFYLSEDTAVPQWECKDPAMKSDCINGIKADGKRCYYDKDNGRKYKNCPELWEKLSTSDIPKSTGVWGESYKIKNN